MIEIKVGRGWSAIILDAVVMASALGAWTLTRATRVHGALHLSHTGRVYLTDKELDNLEGWRQVARLRSYYTCEVCGRPGRLRIGKTRARVFCGGHAHLVGELWPEHDGKIFELDNACQRFSPPAGYGDEIQEREDILRRWSEGQAEMRDVCDFLRIDRAEVYYSSLELGFRIHLVEHPHDEEHDEELAQLLGSIPENTRH